MGRIKRLSTAEAGTLLQQQASNNSCKRPAGGVADHMRISSSARIVSIRSTLWKTAVFFTLLMWLSLRLIKVMDPAAARARSQQPIHVFDITVGLDPDSSARLDRHLHKEARKRAVAAAGDNAAVNHLMNLAAKITSTEMLRPDHVNDSAADESRGANIIATSLDPPAEAAIQMYNGSTSANSSASILPAAAMNNGSAANYNTTKTAAAAAQMDDGSVANTSRKLPAAVVQIHNDRGANGIAKLPAAVVEIQDGSSANKLPPADAIDVGATANRSRKLPAAAEMDIDARTKLPARVEGLIKGIRAAALRANGGKVVQPLSGAAKKEWHEKNPCTSREKLPRMYSRRKFAKDIDANPSWELVFREYEILHRTCTTRIGDLAQYFLYRNTSTGCKFMMCDPTIGSGLGNKILLTTSCFLYAVLTQRVLLVPSGSLLCDIMCEPFEGSSWKIAHPILLGLGPSSAFFESIDSSFTTTASRGDEESLPHSNVDIYATDVSEGSLYQPENRFYCPTEQRFLSNVTCVGLTGCQYIIPKLFSIPTFRPTLESLFPTRMVLTNLLRSLMLPIDVIWRAVESVEAMQPDHADRRLGVQIRYLLGPESFGRLHSGMESRIKRCTLENGLLPKQAPPEIVINTSASTSDTTSPTSTSDSFTSTGSRQPKTERSLQSTTKSSPDHNTTTTTTEETPLRTRVFIASLYDSFQKSLTVDYLQNPPANGEKVTVVQLTQKFEQGWSVEEDAQALVEIILLSFSDDIIVTPMSTFGGVAHAYGALRPWFVRTPPWFVDRPFEYTEPTGPPCVRGQTIDTCQHLPQKQFQCPHDPDFHGKSVAGLAPYLRECLVEDVATGMQLITADAPRH